MFNKTIVLNASNNWQYAVINMSKYSLGELIIYNFNKTPVDGYMFSIKNDSYNYTLTNSYVSKTKINCTVINDIEGKVSIDIRYMMKMMMKY